VHVNFTIGYCACHEGLLKFKHGNGCYSVGDSCPCPDGQSIQERDGFGVCENRQNIKVSLQIFFPNRILGEKFFFSSRPAFRIVLWQSTNLAHPIKNETATMSVVMLCQIGPV